MLSSLYLILLYINGAVLIPGIFSIIEIFSFLIQNKSLNLWDLNCWILLKQLLGINQLTLKGSNLIDKGFILCNHRSIFDIPFDPYTTESTTVGRIGACLFGNMASLLGVFSGRGIWFSRGNTDRNQLMNMLLERMNGDKPYNKRMLFYPEGTRKTYKILHGPDEIKKMIRKGLLKSIYQHKKLPVQLFITANKDYPMNLRTFTARYGVITISKVGSPIYPDDYKTFEEFLNAICISWYYLWYMTHSHAWCIDRVNYQLKLNPFEN